MVLLEKILLDFYHKGQEIDCSEFKATFSMHIRSN